MKEECQLLDLHNFPLIYVTSDLDYLCFYGPLKIALNSECDMFMKTHVPQKIAIVTPSVI